MSATDPDLQQPVTREIIELFRRAGDSQYGHEAVSQREHALQAAHLAERSGADASLITAALLHDLGHLLHHLPDDAPERGIDDRHERLAAGWLARRFGPAVVEPVRLHVAAKRFLCTVEPKYRDRLSVPSLRSYELQGGPMTPAEVAEFRAHPQHQAALALRRWDDEAKVPQLPAPPLEHFAAYIEQALAAR